MVQLNLQEEINWRNQKYFKCVVRQTHDHFLKGNGPNDISAKQNYKHV